MHGDVFYCIQPSGVLGGTASGNGTAPFRNIYLRVDLKTGKKHKSVITMEDCRSIN